jgi:YD repeat-containing protein
VTKAIRDVDTTRTGDFQDLPAGWATPPGGGLHLITRMEVDSFGRTTKLTDPNGNLTYTVYNDPNHETRTYPGWNSTTNTPTGPTRVVREDRGHSPSYVETLTMSAVPNVDANGRPDGSELISDVQTLARTFTSPGGQVIESDAYFNLDGLGYTTDPYLGTAGANYYVTAYGYDERGRPNRTVSPTGTITQTDYDGLSRAIDVRVGTSTANLVLVSQNQYDQGGVGDGDLTQMTEFPGGAAPPRVTQYYYDWRDRQVASKQGVQATEADGTHRPIFYSQYDNLDEVVSSEQYDGDGVTPTVTNGVPDRPPANLLRAKTTTEHDNQNRAFRTHTWSVDQTNGTVSATSLTADTWYNQRAWRSRRPSPAGW